MKLTSIKRLCGYLKKRMYNGQINTCQFSGGGQWYGGEHSGFYVVEDHLRKDAGLIVFSFGVGEDISFDEEIISRWGAAVYAFDPTPKSIDYIKKQDLPDNFIFMPYGISNFDGMAEFYLPSNNNYVSGSMKIMRHLKAEPIKVPMHTFKAILKEVDPGQVDILKMDIEGTEYDVIDEILDSGIEIGQICLEIHSRMFRDGRKKNKKLFESMYMHGYKCIFRSESWEELTFIK